MTHPSLLYYFNELLYKEALLNTTNSPLYYSSYPYKEAILYTAGASIL